MPGHLPHLATAKQGRLEFFDSLKHRPKGRCFFARIAAFGGWNAGDGVPYSKNCRATPPGVAGPHLYALPRGEGGPRRGSGEEFGQKPTSQYNTTDLQQRYH